MIVEGLADALDGFRARTATSIRLRINLLRMLLLLQRELLTAGEPVEDAGALRDRLGEWRTTPEAIGSLLAQFPELEADGSYLTSETLALVDEVSGLLGGS